MKGQMQQLQGLFELLNQQSILSQDTYQPKKTINRAVLKSFYNSPIVNK